MIRRHSWFARTVIIPALVLLGTGAPWCEGQPVTLEQHLNALAEKGLPGPVVATLELPPSEKAGQSAEGDTSSLAGIAHRFGLKLFTQDGIYVIGPAQRYDFAPLFSGELEPRRSAGELCSELLHSLNEAQFRGLASPQGLPFPALTREQQAMLAAVFAPGNVVAYAESASEPDLSTAIPAETMPIHTCRISAWLEVHRVTVGALDPDIRDRVLVRHSVSVSPNPRPAGWRLLIPRENGTRRSPRIRPGVLVANTLKDSNLDYSLRALRVPISAGGLVSLRDVIARAAKKTGLKLHASPGADQVPLFISASSVPIGRLLKAVSLATTGTWRQFGNAYVFSPDLAGIGQVAAKLDELRGFSDLKELGLAVAAYRLVRDRNRFPVLSFAPDSEFALYAEQIERMLAAAIPPPSPGREWLEWRALSAEQQALLEEEMAVLHDTRSGRGLEGDPGSWVVNPRVRLAVAFHFPNTGPVYLSESLVERVSGLRLLPPREDPAAVDCLRMDAPANLRLPLNKPLRGYVCKPSKREKPASLISTIEEHGFNTLYLRVFTDGYTAFPNEQFPRMAGLGEDYLEEVISLAHAKEIKVFGVVDVLRWSDGRRGHWVTKRKDLLDYDMFGRTHAQWANSRVAPQVAPAIEELVLGEAVTGDVVTPLSDKVGAKLLGLLEELGSFSLDGLVFDRATILHPREDWFGDYAAGQPGHNESARGQFFRKHGIDSIDVLARHKRYIVRELPLQPVISACSELGAAWEAFHKTKCDDLLHALVNRWSELRKNSPIWVMDTGGVRGASHNWSKFKGQIEGAFLNGMEFRPQGARSASLKAVPLVRASEQVGSLAFATILASGQGQKFEGMFTELSSRDSPWETEGILIDFTCAGRKKNDYLRLIAPPEPESR